MTKFDFTEEEVQLNKKGVLSPRQKGVIKAMAHGIRSSSKSGVWVILGFAALGLCIIIPLNMQGLNERSLPTLGPQLAAGLCFTVFAVLAITALMFFNSRRQAAKLEAAPLLSAEGIISHDSDYSSSGNFRTYYVYFGKKRFSFPNEMNRVFPEGSTFRIYYCKVGQIELIMSFERLV
ncbi:MAG: hypothetical protein HZB18_11445 [Chloroflexi bacterium]|nr:hypothetical protein [Chloroflexota bacterium]